MNLADTQTVSPSQIEFQGVVEHGDSIGRVLGYPTANIAIPDGTPEGVWCGVVKIGDDARSWPAAISIGTRPTYYRRGVLLLEAHLLSFDGDLYGKQIHVELGERLRGQYRFEDQDHLVNQIRLDIKKVSNWATEHFGRIS